MRTEIISVLKQHFESHILKHKMNVDIMLSNPTAIHDHTDLMDAIEKEVALMAEYQDKLEIMEVYFKE
jgi:3-deoxy-D-arabino-heptulosonate 7-phosphate (DAHP) synthase